MTIRRLLAALAASLLMVCTAHAQYPNKPIRIIVPFPPGGAVDALAREIGQKIGPLLGQSIVIENRPGAAGAIGSELAAKSAADGYTLLMGSTTTLSINPSLQKLPYDPIKDFAPITLVAFVPHILTISAEIPAGNLGEFIAYAKARPGRLSYASSGAGSPHHIAGEMFKSMTGLDLVHVPYKGTGPAVVDLISGQVSLMSVEAIAALPHIKSGKLRAMGVATPVRNPIAPDIPTVSEAGLKGFDVTSWYGVVAPAGLPADVAARLADTISKALETEELRNRLSSLGATPVGGTPESFGVHMKREGEKWAKAVKDSGARPD